MSIDVNQWNNTLEAEVGFVNGAPPQQQFKGIR